MKKEKPFYIGWQAEMSKEHKSTIKKFIIPIFIALPILAFVIISSQKAFNNFQFEFGKSTELKGVYHSTPVPLLEVKRSDMKAELSNHVLLVGYGKLGAEGIMDEIEKENGALDGKTITLQGSLIYGDGKTLMELNKENNSLVTVHEDGLMAANNASPLITATMRGEILDPKCYFGVMKPGEGKIHKSCAILCISGGIPPVLRTISAEQEKEYYILLGENGEKINGQLLDKIAEPVEISGKVTKMNGWNYLYTKSDEIQIIKN